MLSACHSDSQPRGNDVLTSLALHKLNENLEFLLVYATLVYATCNLAKTNVLASSLVISRIMHRMPLSGNKPLQGEARHLQFMSGSPCRGLFPDNDRHSIHYPLLINCGTGSVGCSWLILGGFMCFEGGVCYP